MKFRSATRTSRTEVSYLANNVGQEAEETRALDGAREFTLLLGRDCGDAARHDLAARGDVAHKDLEIFVVNLRRIRPREGAGLAATKKRPGSPSFSHVSSSSPV